MSSEKTEQPTQKKLRDARRKGDVPKSKDFTQTLLILSLFGYLIGRGKAMYESLTGLILVPPTLMDMPFDSAVSAFTHMAAKEVAMIVAPFLVIVLAVGIFGEMIQSGVLLAFEKLKPSGKKLNALTNLKQIFSKKNFVEFLKSTLKIVFLSVLVYKVLMNALPQLFTLPRAGLEGVFSAISTLMLTLLINVALAYLVIGLADLAWQRFQHRTQLKMSKDEVKREYKEMEGDPHVKGMRRRLQREMATEGSVKRARNATVVVTNPTHVAIALYYKQDDPDSPLPLVLAKGEGAVAEAMIREARDAGVPIVQNIPLARGMLADATVDEYIPEVFLEPVAEVLRFVREMLGPDDRGDGS
ncbi:type III secretion system export apparatus subunit SctU [Robbsia andropogonis]|uniref:type III secretion system export apparatus subunit SctU n=1 Tax=Robbsia andropogonis TaxID=28092 RepID=UPI0004B20ADB|nr:type III secretion system export apparatus subunit SctU [Robbsia andropogonis]MCP1117104.1 type III secretion system export apparatus subunit SctU [Robbsia andropogonis]MCP1128450.1 type III secretion system export apparatus subunit SctU [Robbsia andropogonis]